MKIQLIRNATMRITYAGQTILTDPCLAAKATLPSYAGRSPNPIAGLPVALEQVLDQIDMVLVSHLHKDHFDETAKTHIPGDMPILCRPRDAGQLKEGHFSRVQLVDNETEWNGISIQTAPARHGSSDGVLRDMGSTCGFILSARGEPTLYWAGDTVWYEAVMETIDKWRPDVILTHSGGAVWDKEELIVMDALQTIDLSRYSPASQVIAIHLEAFDHCTVTRDSLRQVAIEAGLGPDRLVIPADGEEIVIRAVNSDQ